MKLKHKKTGKEYFSTRWTVNGFGGVNVGDDDVQCTDLDIFVKGQWKDMRQAFRDKDVMSDNLDLNFGEPTAEDIERGYRL